VNVEAQAYVDGLPPDRRALFDRVHALILEVFPDAQTTISYAMPTYVVDRYRLYVGAWKHGLSFYGWNADRDGGLSARHPELVSGNGTLRFTFRVADQIDDDEIRSFVRATLGG
jgi:uncharacterized protein YdhG (YjbR/CyaY superfamily)